MVNYFLPCIVGNGKPQHMFMIIHINSVRYLIFHRMYKTDTRIKVDCTRSVGVMIDHRRINFREHLILPAIADHKIIILMPAQFLIPQNPLRARSSHYECRSLCSISRRKQEINHRFALIHRAGGKHGVRFTSKNQAAIHTISLPF